MIALKNVTKSYGENTVLSNLTLRVDPGACMCITGESGSGKTTLQRLLIRADDPDRGTVDVDGVNIRSLPPAILQLYRRRVGVVFQEPLLIDHLTVEENIGLPLELPGAPHALIKRNTNDLLKRMGLLEKAHSFPKSLSLGEQSLVGIARALITAPMVLIADEPFLNLDAAQSKIVVELFKNVHKKGATVVIFSRDASVAAALHAQRVHLHQGAIVKQAEQEKSVAKPMDAHRILEETETETADGIFLSHDANEGESLNIGIPDKKTPSSGKRIRITSIGSNS